MSSRLTINEFDFLQKVLQTIIDCGDTVTRTASYRDAGKNLEKLFGLGRADIIAVTNKIRVVKDKIDSQASG